MQCADACLSEAEDLAELAARVLVEIDSERGTTQSMAALLCRHPTLMDRVMRAANSPLLGRGGRAGSLPQAIARLGAREVRDIVSRIPLERAGA